LIFAGAFADDLCASWTVALGSTKCGPGQTCCAETSNFPPNCTSPLTCQGSGVPPNCSTGFITQEDFGFAADGSYSDTFLVGTGNCPLDWTSGTLTAGVITYGTYLEQGPNTNISGNWSKLIYKPGKFTGLLSKTNKNCFFTPGFTVGTSPGVTGPCVDLQMLFNDPDYGCPCNGNWTLGTPRDINKTQCPLNNGSDACPENYFFSTNLKYGNYRVYNISSGTMRQLDITRPVFDQNAAWNDSNVFATYTANFSCPAAISPTPAPHSNAPILSSSVAVLATLWMML